MWEADEGLRIRFSEYARVGGRIQAKLPTIARGDVGSEAPEQAFGGAVELAAEAEHVGGFEGNVAGPGGDTEDAAQGAAADGAFVGEVLVAMVGEALGGEGGDAGFVEALIDTEGDERGGLPGALEHPVVMPGTVGKIVQQQDHGAHKWILVLAASDDSTPTRQSPRPIPRLGSHGGSAEAVRGLLNGALAPEGCGALESDSRYHRRR